MCLYFLIFFSSDIGLLPIIVLVRSCLLYPLLGEIVVVAAIDHCWWWWWSWSWWWSWKKWWWQWWWYWLAGGLVGCVNQWRWQNLPPNAHGLTLGGAVVGFTYTVIFSIILVVVSVYCISQLMRKHCDHNILQSITRTEVDLHTASSFPLLSLSFDAAPVSSFDIFQFMMSLDKHIALLSSLSSNEHSNMYFSKMRGCQGKQILLSSICERSLCVCVKDPKICNL